MCPTRPLIPLALCVLLSLPVLATAQATAPAPHACPKEVPADARCFTGSDGQGSFYWVALPAQWQKETGVLVMHAHGGPADTGASTLARTEADLKRWAITVKAGHAWAGSSYRRGGYGVTMAAEDTERLRQLFVQHFRPTPSHVAAWAKLRRWRGSQGGRAVQRPAGSATTACC
jgi:hypothetical protein